MNERKKNLIDKLEICLLSVENTIFNNKLSMHKKMDEDILKICKATLQINENIYTQVNSFIANLSDDINSDYDLLERNVDNMVESAISQEGVSRRFVQKLYLEEGKNG